MKHVINGKVIGHRLFHPDPKDHPSLELLMVEIELGAVGKAFAHAKGKKSSAKLIVHLEEAKGLDLGDFVQITVSDSQQKLALQDRAAHRERAGAQADPR